MSVVCLVATVHEQIMSVLYLVTTHTCTVSACTCRLARPSQIMSVLYLVTTHTCTVCICACTCRLARPSQIMSVLYLVTTHVHANRFITNNVAVVHVLSNNSCVYAHI